MTKGFRPPLPILERLARKSVIDEVTGCYLYPTSLDAAGYARVMTGSRTDGTRRVDSVHRIAWREEHGPIPPGLEVHHECFQRNCWNVAHLALVTQAENKALLSPEGLEKKRVVMREIQKVRWVAA